MDMYTKFEKIAFGGGCHWCTEAVFQILKGVEKVEQGYVSSVGKNQSFSEAVIVHFNPEIINLERFLEIHLRTHKSASNHSFREKYRSAIYTFSIEQETQAEFLLEKLQSRFEYTLQTKIFPFKRFKPSRAELHNYYKNNPEKPFCKKYIDPKLKLVLASFPENIRNTDFQNKNSEYEFNNQVH